MRHIISLGAGVQSSTMALMAAHGEIKPVPECAIFADTGWEPAAVYAYLELLEQRLPFPVHRVRRARGTGSIREDQVQARAMGQGGRWASLPYYTRLPGSRTEGRTARQCTAEYKIEPIETFMRRQLLGLRPGQWAPRKPVLVQWRGISRDEASRMKPSREPWFRVRYPLAMEHGMTRADCLRWLQRHGYPEPARSACIGCPFHSDHEWRRIRDHAPDEWADAVEFDRQIRKSGGMRGDTFLHRSCVPLDEVDLATAEDRGQRDWINECEGMCGV